MTAIGRTTTAFGMSQTLKRGRRITRNRTKRRVISASNSKGREGLRTYTLTKTRGKGGVEEPSGVETVASSSQESSSLMKHPLLQLHIAVFLFSISGLFGRALDLSPFVIVAGRTFFGSTFLALLVWFNGDRPVADSPARASRLQKVCLGALLAFHWSAFFYSVQLAGVAIGVLTFSSFPLFVTVVEPRISGTSLHLHDLGNTLLVCLGLALVIPSYQLGDHATQGALWGIVSGCSFAVLSLFNRHLVAKESPVRVALTQNSYAFLFLLPFVLYLNPALTGRDLLLLVVLGVFCTAIAHSLFVSSLRAVRTLTASLVALLEPVYGIVFAALVYHEKISLRMSIGGILILSGALIGSLRHRSPPLT